MFFRKLRKRIAELESRVEELDRDFRSLEEDALTANDIDMNPDFNTLDTRIGECEDRLDNLED